MDLKGHILEAMREQFDRWESLLAQLSDDQILSPLEPSPWSGKDIMAHLWAWQQRSNARLKAAATNSDPEYSALPPGLDPNVEQDIDRINTWLYDTYRDSAWPQVYQNWRQGFLLFLELGQAIPEFNLLESGLYAWHSGEPLVFTVIACYNHHHEHYEEYIAWLNEHGVINITG